MKSLHWHPVYRCSGEVSAHANCYLSPPSHSQGKNDSTTKDHNSSALDTAPRPDKILGACRPHGKTSACAAAGKEQTWHKVLFVHIWNDEHYVHVQFISSVWGRDQWTIQSVRSRCPRVEKLLNTHGCHIKQDIWLTERINQYKDKPDTVKMAIFM